MKALLAGCLSLLIIGLVAFAVLKGRGLIPTSPESSPSPATSTTPAPFVYASPTPVPATPTPRPTATPKPQVNGVSTTKTTTTTIKTISTHKLITFAQVSKCPSEVTSELRDITTPLTLQYQIKSGYSAAITVWGDNNIELKGQTTYAGDGKLVSSGNNNNLKVLIQPASCPAAEDNWMSVTASN